jgi:hypothetical protein
VLKCGCSYVDGFVSDADYKMFPMQQIALLTILLSLCSRSRSNPGYGFLVDNYILISSLAIVRIRNNFEYDFVI